MSVSSTGVFVFVSYSFSGWLAVHFMGGFSVCESVGQRVRETTCPSTRPLFATTRPCHNLSAPFHTYFTFRSLDPPPPSDAVLPVVMAAPDIPFEANLSEAAKKRKRRTEVERASRLKIKNARDQLLLQPPVPANVLVPAHTAVRTYFEGYWAKQKRLQREREGYTWADQFSVYRPSHVDPVLAVKPSSMNNGNSGRVAFLPKFAEER
jgi:hypothetical protein